MRSFTKRLPSLRRADRALVLADDGRESLPRRLEKARSAIRDAKSPARFLATALERHIAQEIGLANANDWYAAPGRSTWGVFRYGSLSKVRATMWQITLAIQSEPLLAVSPAKNEMRGNSGFSEMNHVDAFGRTESCRMDQKGQAARFGAGPPRTARRKARDMLLVGAFQVLEKLPKLGVIDFAREFG
ncbi:MAG: hypothetical protein ABIP39_05070 [Polyangiaceae bacterium]